MNKSIKIIKFALLTLCAALILQGCAAVVVGVLVNKSSKSKQQKNLFLTEFNKINLEREKAGLPPLDKCVEMFYFDPGWAREHAECKSKIDSLVAAGVQPDTTHVLGK